MVCRFAHRPRPPTPGILDVKVQIWNCRMLAIDDYSADLSRAAAIGTLIRVMQKHKLDHTSAHLNTRSTTLL